MKLTSLSTSLSLILAILEANVKREKCGRSYRFDLVDQTKTNKNQLKLFISGNNFIDN